MWRISKQSLSNPLKQQICLSGRAAASSAPQHTAVLGTQRNARTKSRNYHGPSMRSTIVMTTERSASAVAAECKFRIIRRAAEMVRFGWRAFWRWRYRQMTIRLLRSMDERLLPDIGVDPLSLQSFFAKGGPPSTNPFGDRNAD
jgi:uncharacterized protein YjiS (DUF1127 family)